MRWELVLTEDEHQYRGFFPVYKDIAERTTQNSIGAGTANNGDKTADA